MVFYVRVALSGLIIGLWRFVGLRPTLMRDALSGRKPLLKTFNPFTSLLILCVRAYQIVLSPHLGSCCRFYPTCSNYAIEALRTHGFFKGAWLTARRLVRCRPFGPSGYDPVPPKSQPRSPT